ncbi:hypothetical protein [Arthrobacter sp. ERGS1:01]|uniref:hypothetical protein n=1 Tax=Arthrobacter sp. ERGS1:01 TaxID=1704044 RepID=UPI001ED98B8D|nr:hypothetical protein [Arthrobacter sp. ERGS1:01]
MQERLGRFFWADPRAILRADASPEEFRRAMSAIEVGGTYKITGANRHPGADELMLANLDLADAVIVDIGASDGSTSLDLISKLGGFKQYIIADKYLRVFARENGRKTYFYDDDGNWILVVGSRVLAWPATSGFIRALFGRGARTAAHRVAPREVLLLNPAVQQRMAADPRVTARVHDVFLPWEGQAPDVIKVANLLRRLYFPDADIVRALEVLLGNLPDGGHLVIVDNPRIDGMPPRCGLYRRDGGRFVVVAESENVPEISTLVTGVDLGDRTDAQRSSDA